jgi:hypothetical protein
MAAENIAKEFYIAHPQRSSVSKSATEELKQIFKDTESVANKHGSTCPRVSEDS